MFSLISWGAVGLGVLVSIVLGSIWFGPLFGKKWMTLMGMNPNDTVKIEEGKKQMWKMYVIQMIASAMTVAALSIVVLNFDNFTIGETVGTSLLMWIGFVIPSEIGSVLWSGKSYKEMREIFLLNAGYGLILFVLLGCIVAQVG